MPNHSEQKTTVAPQALCGSGEEARARRSSAEEEAIDRAAARILSDYRASFEALAK